MSRNFRFYLGHRVNASWRLDGSALSRKFTGLDSNSEHRPPVAEIIQVLLAVAACCESAVCMHGSRVSKRLGHSLPMALSPFWGFPSTL